MWDKIKKAVNTTLGKDNFQPLDKILDYEEYLRLYMSALSKQMVNRQDSEILADCEGQKIYRAIYDDNNYRWRNYVTHAKLFLFAPWVEEIQETAYFSQGIVQVILPPKLKKINCEGAFASTDLGVRIPPSVEEIHEAAFRNFMDEKVYIYSKKGAISGYPWGHQRPENIIYMYE